MKTFKTFISELQKPQTWEEYQAIIEDKCKPFLEEVGGWVGFNARPLYRGMSEKPTAEVRVRKDRKPLNSSSFEHRVLSKFFIKEFGINHREESVMTTTSYGDASGYGTAHRIFPVGDYKFVYTPEKEGGDVTYLLRYGMDDVAAELAVDKGVDVGTAEYDEWFERNQFAIAMKALKQAGFTDKNLVRGLDSRAEIMFNCDSYIAVPEDVWDEYEKRNK